MAGTAPVGAGVSGAIEKMRELVGLTLLAANQSERLLLSARGLNELTPHINVAPGVSSGGSSGGGGGSRVRTPGEAEILNRLTAWEQKGHMDGTINFRAGGWR